MTGRRVYCNDRGQFWLDAGMTKGPVESSPGDYWIYLGHWASRLPNGLRCGLSKNHTITEHEDGTITASPSILMECPGAHEWDWHGYLERGMWRSC